MAIDARGSIVVIFDFGNEAERGKQRWGDQKQVDAREAYLKLAQEAKRVGGSIVVVTSPIDAVKVWGLSERGGLTERRLKGYLEIMEQEGNALIIRSDEQLQVMQKSRNGKEG